MHVSSPSAAGPWQLVFRTCSSNNALKPADVWLDPTAGQVTPIEVYNGCTGTEKSHIINQWDQEDVEAVSINFQIVTYQMCLAGMAMFCTLVPYFRNVILVQ
jgi:hypothetical protein